MSTSKHIDKFCIAAIAVALVLALLFSMGAGTGLASSDREMGYENRLFDTSSVHTIDIVMNDWDSFIESCESEEYSPCTLVIDGEKLGNVAIRAKGNTSLSSVSSMGSQRYSFKIEFDQYEDSKSYHGLDKLCLNNIIQDNTMMKDFLVYRMMDEFGAETPLCSFVYITVNGDDWGLYLAVEGVEDSFLQRNYGSDTGELYKPDSMSFGGGRGNGKDFSMDDLDFGGDSENTESSDSSSDGTTTSSQDNGGGFSFGGKQPPQGGMSQGGPGNGGDFQPPEGFSGGDFQLPEGFSFDNMPQMPGGGGGFGGFGMGSDDVKLKYIDDDPDSYSNIFSSAKTDVSKADQKRLISSLKNLSEYTDLENTLDIEEVLRYFVVHNFVVNGDSYTGTIIHNYYLHEKDGLLSMIPWDYNLAFGTFQGNNASESVNASIDSPVSGDVDDRPMVGWIFSSEEYTEMYHELFSEFLSKWFDNGRLVQLIEETEAMIRPYVEKDPTKFCTTEEFDKGVAAITQFVTLRSEAVERQLSGDTTAVDTSELTISDMGTMGGGFGGGKGQDGDRDSSSDGNDSQSQSEFTPPSGFTKPDGNGFDAGSSTGFSASGDGSFPQGFGTPPSQNGSQSFSAPSGQESSADSSSGQPSMPTDMSFPTQESSQSSAAVWIGISVVILAAGLLIAVKKKY